MLVRVIVDHVPHLGIRGTVVDVPDRGGRLLVLAGRVEKVEETSEVLLPEPAKPKYKRRDIKPKNSAPEVETASGS